ncbi:MAG: hypothetical protein D6702_01190 [Planctomycetota bacterium]|nr:MAG: hypothetical protein D6702_01190 [Planctomycetota bacterium]
MSRRRPSFLLAALILLPACAAHDELPAGSGRGLVSWDRQPPAGAETFARPEWTVGDRFVYRRGDEIRAAFRVDAIDENGIRLVEEESGLFEFLDRDLGERGQDMPGLPKARRVFDPADSGYSWPLWVGKRWTCHYLSKRPGQKQPLPLLVRYECDAVEEVTVPAGTFRCLRIWRRARVAAKGSFKERTSLSWYSPEVGWFVRRLNADELTELVEVHRQGPAAGAAPDPDPGN